MLYPSTCPSLLEKVRDLADHHSWDRLVRLYTPVIYRYSVQQGINSRDAEDVVQEVFLTLAKVAPTFQYDPARGRFRNWLAVLSRRIVARRQQSELLRAPPQVDFDLDAIVSEQPDSEWVELLEQQLWHSAVAKVRVEIDARRWAAFVAVWFEDQSPAEVAARLGVQPAWVHKAKFSVLKRLRAVVSELARDTIHFSD